MKKRVMPFVYIIVAAIVCVAALYTALAVMGYTYMINEQGIRFIGRTANGQPVSGTIKYPTGETAELDYINHSITFSNGDVYTGSISGLNRHGQGEMRYAGTGDVYAGSFVNDEISGEGVYTYSGGDVYVGSLSGGRYHGKGEMLFADGSSYNGSFEHGVKSGYGVYKWATDVNGRTAWYEGYFADDVKSGQGTMHYANGDVYKGGFVSDKRSGKGVYTWADGEKYSGSFVQNLIDTRIVNADGEFLPQGAGFVHGEEGVYTFVSGKTYTGYFEAGKVVGLETDIRGTT